MTTTRATIVALTGILAGVMCPPMLGQAAAEDVPDHIKAATTRPSAHNPCFDKKGLWPADVKKTAYYKETWEPARLLVWAGERKGQIGDKQLKDPANWVEFPASEDGYGEPREAKTPPDGKTDVVFPDVPRAMRTGGISCRHLTIGSNVRFGSSPGIGNVWAYGQVQAAFLHLTFRGDKDTFFRGGGTAKALRLNKAEGASVELLGSYRVGDWTEFNTGTFIIGPDATLMAGPRHQNIIAPKGTLVLMDGATYRTVRPKSTDTDLRIWGTVMAGMPDRPLKKDATFALNGKTKGGSSLRLTTIGVLAVHSADPKTVRLVFRMRDWPDDSKRPHKKVPIDLFLAGKTDFDGVRFEDMRTGGIRLTGRHVRESWKHVSFGHNSADDPDDLFAYDIRGVHIGRPGFGPQGRARQQLQQLKKEADARKESEAQ
jgi:hypothetical protein